MFTVEAVQLGALKRVIVGHDGTGAGFGWFLEKVIIKESPKARFEQVFDCRRSVPENNP